jgi:ATP-dependent protease HslVU (ClpYQ) peptidase subunit
MTCIVAVTHEGSVYMAGERGASTDDTILPSQDPKIARRGGFIIGYAGNYGLGQLMLHGLKIPPLPRRKGSLLPFMRTTFHQAFITAIEKSKYKMELTQEDTQSGFLIGVRGQLFEYEPIDGQMALFEETAIGSGAAFAFGSLFSTRGMDAEDRVKLATAAACQYSTSCCEPIDVLVN